MACCQQCLAAAKLFSEQVARKDLRRYRRRGPDASTKLLLEEVRQRAQSNASLLDVGGGIGAIGQELLAAGFRSAVEVEVAPAYAAVATAAFQERGFGARSQVVEGDLVELADTIQPADVVTLDRVVCCYVDYVELIRRSATLAVQLLAFSYPRDRWYVRRVAALGNFWRLTIGDSFRTFVHPPTRMTAVAEGCGFVLATHRHTLVWGVDVFTRHSPQLR